MLSSPANPGEDIWLFPRLWAGFLIIFVGVTLPLWFRSDMWLAVPMHGAILLLPAWINNAFSAMLCLIALAALLFCRRWCWAAIATLLILQFAIDQHRLQPWAYQTAIYAMVFCVLKPAVAKRWLIPLAASIYIYSAAGKLDYQFTHTVGLDFLRTIARPIGGLPEGLEMGTLATMALAFPVTELVIGVFLLPKLTRRWAGIAAILMHLSLIGMLGPWGLNHSAGVLIWNVLLMIQSWFLFVGPSAPIDEESPDAASHGLGFAIVKLAVIGAIAMPVVERSGCWDHWPSWALYSPHNSRCDIEFHRSGMNLLPDEMQAFVQPDDNGDGWQSFSLDDWSLETRHVPIYPQARYQLGISLAIADACGINDQIRGRLKGVSDRRTGNRLEKPMLGRTELQQAAKNFWLLP